MTKEIGYQTTDPHAISVWQGVEKIKNEQHALRAEYQRTLTGEIGPSKHAEFRAVYVYQSYFGAVSITGVGSVDGNWSGEGIPEGLRFDKPSRHLVPALRTPEGKAIREFWDSMSTPDHDKKALAVGVLDSFATPTDPSTGRSMRYFPTVFLSEDQTTLYALWGTSYVDEKAVEFQKLSRIEWTELSRAELRAIVKA